MASEFATCLYFAVYFYIFESTATAAITRAFYFRGIFLFTFAAWSRHMGSVEEPREAAGQRFQHPTRPARQEAANHPSNTN